MMFFPLKKLRRYSKYLLLGLILLVGVAVYHEMIAVKAWSSESSMNPDSSSWRRAMFDERVKKDRVLDSMGDSDAWKSSYTPQPWKPEYKGLANLHVFEDWCGSSIADLCKNMHYPLYPHARTTVPKLAVSPQWTNYGLRIFGYLHPYIDGEFVFALSSDDNSEFWLSTDDSPFNLQLLAWVGKTGTEWTIPGEFDKYASQTSKPVWLSAQRKYFFEVVYKQNDRGTDHVEVAWQLVDQDFRFMVIESSHISLYVNESALLLSDVAHIPLTAASHQRTATKQQDAPADMLRGDLRDTLYQVPLINSKFLQGVLPDCTYKPSYTIKDLPLLRYQGLQFVRMSYVYPNDYTRLTHMESPESCFYPESPYYMKMFGFSRYMRLDRPNVEEEGNKGRDFGFQRSALHEEEDRFYNAAYQRGKEIRPNQREKFLFPDYGDDFDDYAQKRRRKLFSLHTQETKILSKSTSETRPRIDVVQRRQRKDGDRQLHKPVETLQQVPLQASKLTHIKLNPEGQVRRVGQIKPKVNLKTTKRRKFKSSEGTARPVKINPVIPVDKEQFKAKEPPEHLNFKQRSRKMIHNHVLTLKESKLQLKQQRFETRNNTRTTPKTEIPVVRQIQEDAHARKQFKDKEIPMNMPPQQDEENSIYKMKSNIGGKMDRKESDAEGVENQAWDDNNVDNRDLSRSDFRKGERESLWGQQEDTDDEDLSPTLVFDSQVNWNQTFQVSHLDLQTHRLDMIDLRCNISGNLLLHATGSLHVVKAFMDQLNQKHHGQFTLVNVVNVVKRVDEAKGNRYLLELELKDANGQLLRLSHYVYTLISYSRQRRREFRFQRMKPPMLLCNPVGIQWNPDVTVHFIVPVKNQARWVQQLIADMEQLFRDTQDTNFNLIITDYNSTDMDVRMALEKSSLPRYKYVKLSGNFERSAGLQAGVDIIDDEHSIVFLCDLHIQFPPSIIDTIRKHCVEGYMAFAPIVMRLNCGATPLDARGYWEVNGFGLLGIYKSDLDAAGGMNTREFTDRWGGEDWELLDRILQAGLEVERIYLRNFFHHYHSKRGMWNRRIALRQR